MFQIALILFREIFEVTLLIGVIMNAARDIPNRKSIISTGVIIGLLGSAILGYSSTLINHVASGVGQELINSIILFAACFMIIWTILWMKHHATSIKERVKDLGYKIQQGEISYYVLISLISVAVLREGTEIILFIQGTLAVKSMTITQLLTAALIGISGGVIVGLATYFGLLKYTGKYLFRVTSALLALFAAGMAAQIPNNLASAGVITKFTSPIWDSSWLLTEDSLIGKLIQGLTGYTAKPSPVQLLFYIGTIALIIVLLKMEENEQRTSAH